MQIEYPALVVKYFYATGRAGVSPYVSWAGVYITMITLITIIIQAAPSKLCATICAAFRESVTKPVIVDLELIYD